MQDQRGNLDEGHVPVPRHPADDDVAVGTAHPHHETGDSHDSDSHDSNSHDSDSHDSNSGDDLRNGDAHDDVSRDGVTDEAYPAGTYASGSVVTDTDRDGLTDRDDVEVVDHDQALAEERADEGEGEDAGADEDDAVDEFETRDELQTHDEENEARGDGDFVPGDVTPPADERDEVEVAAVEESEDRAWTEEHIDSTGHIDDTLAEPVATSEALEGGEALDAGDVVALPVPVDGDAGQDLRPGAVQPVPVGAIWADGAAEGLRERWRELQLRFIDDPRSVAGEADALVAEAVSTVTGALESHRAQLSAWQGEGGDDTERLRAAVRQYRDFLDHLLGL